MILIPKNKQNDCFNTPEEWCKVIVNHFKPTGRVLEPCKGSGNFLKYLPDAEWCEIQEGKDFLEYTGKVDWIVTNPPFSLMRKFLIKAMEVSDNIVFFTTINHLWLKARIRDIEEHEFGIKEIMITDTPKNFPQSGFQFGCFYLKRGYTGNITFSKCGIK